MFKEIEITNGVYSIDENGIVKNNKTNKRIKPFLNNKGYMCITLRVNNLSKNFLVHRLVALTFLPNDKNYTIINHIDCNPLNNHVSNLEWCTYSHNNKYAYTHGNRTLTEKQLEARRKPKTYKHRPISQYDMKGNLIAHYESLYEASV